VSVDREQNQKGASFLVFRPEVSPNLNYFYEGTILLLFVAIQNPIYFPFQASLASPSCSISEDSPFTNIKPGTRWASAKPKSQYIAIPSRAMTYLEGEKENVVTQFRSR
jgi:hypothetical protein